MARKLASTQRILKLEPIPDADKIEVATVLGWKVVVRKGEFKVGQLCMYFEVDSLIPRKSWSSFLFKVDARPTPVNDEDEYVRLKTRKMRGQISQGLLVPLSPIELEHGTLCVFQEDEDWTDHLGVKKWEPTLDSSLRPNVKGNFPDFLKKTDETRIQSVPWLLEKYGADKFYISEKNDGQSGSAFILNGEFGMCSRNRQVKLDEDSAFKTVAQTYDLESKLASLNKNIAIQGELIGPKIQGNKYRLKDYKLLIFNVWDIDGQFYYDFYDMIGFCSKLGLDTVPIIDANFTLKDSTVDSLVEMSVGQSRLANTQREGLVFRTLEEKHEPYKGFGRVSFKVINPKFLLKYGE